MPTPLPRDMPAIDRLHGDALEDVKRGLRVARRAWPEGMYLFERAQIVHIHVPEGADGLKAGDHQYLLHLDDIGTTDWVVVR